MIHIELEQKVIKFIEKHDMVSKGDGIVIGLSGGADSVALLELLCSFRESMQLALIAVHVHHGIRAEAQEDADFCKKLCHEKQVTFFCEYADVPALAQKQGLTIEEAGRSVRYQFFEKYRQQFGLDKIAVAHHQNDQAETMLFQLFRGSGLRGMAGIPVKRDFIIRPMLCISRTEIEQYLQAKSLTYVTDMTNFSDKYTRNKIRRHILPMAEEISVGAVSHMSHAGEQFREILDFLEQETEAFLTQYANSRSGRWVIQAEALKQAHTALQKMIVLSALERTIGSRKNITERHVEAVLELLQKDGEKVVHLPKGFVAIKRYGELIFKDETKENDTFFNEIEVFHDSIYELPDGRKVETRLFSADENKLENIPKNDCIKWFDYDKIIGVLVLRYRKKGDYLTIQDNGARKSLQDYLVNEKVPKSERDKLIVLADGNHILWIPGMRISAYYKVSKQTKQILEVYIGGKKHGREN